MKVLRKCQKYLWQKNVDLKKNFTQKFEPKRVLAVKFDLKSVGKGCGISDEQMTYTSRKKNKLRFDLHPNERLGPF